MITTINEFRKINEGGGAGISFTCEAALHMDATLIREERGKYRITMNDYKVSCDSFDAKGYDDGMSNVSTKILEWKAPEITSETLLGLTIESEDGITVRELFETRGIKRLNIVLDVDYIYDNMHFGGWMRGKLGDGDLIFSQRLNRHGVDYNSFAYVFTWEEQQGTSDYDIDNAEVLLDLAPEAYGKEDLKYWFDDVFNYDLTEDAKVLAYQEVMDDDYHDSTIEEYMDENGILDSLEVYKQSLKSEDYHLPEDLYDFIQSEKDVEERANDMHWDDVKANWGV